MAVDASVFVVYFLNIDAHFHPNERANELTNEQATQLASKQKP